MSDNHTLVDVHGGRIVCMRVDSFPIPYAEKTSLLLYGKDCFALCGDTSFAFLIFAGVDKPYATRVPTKQQNVINFTHLSNFFLSVIDSFV